MKTLLLLLTILSLSGCGVIGTITLNPDGTTDVDVTVPPVPKDK